MEEESDAPWVCDACGANRNSMLANPEHCGICGTRRSHHHNQYYDDEESDPRDEEMGDYGSGSGGAIYRLSSGQSSLEHAISLFSRHHGGITGLQRRGARDRDRVRENSRSSITEEESAANLLREENLLKLARGETVSEDEHENEEENEDDDDDDATPPTPTPTPPPPLYDPTWIKIPTGSPILLSPFNPKIAINTSSSKSAVRTTTSLSATNRSKAIGWKLMFHNPALSPGSSLGGNHLAGVTTSRSMKSFPNVRYSGLQTSGQFWGLADTGKIYEGDDKTTSIAQFRRSDRSSDSSDDVFGNLQVLTIVASIPDSTLSYWRDGTLIGRIVRSLPFSSSSELFPCCVLFSPNVSCYITGLHGDPHELMRLHISELQRVKLLEDRATIEKLAEQKSRLMSLETATLSPAVCAILRKICR